MKGIIFTEFLEMVEEKFGYETVDHVIENSGLPHDGIYTAVGKYPHEEMVSMVLTLHQKTSLPISDLLQEYGRYLFHKLIALYPKFKEGRSS
ncbi:MAG: heme NO-binding domain-containing protein, partial [Ekhidna sp.]|nr:heme NO-binding domain-containing protein [Ekhidna sp.]